VPSTRTATVFDPLASVTGRGLPAVAHFTSTRRPTPKSNAEEWPQLAQRLANGTLVLFPHARLREELLNLTVEVGPTGARITDRGRVHQDHAVAVRGVVASLGHAGEGYVAVRPGHGVRIPDSLSPEDQADALGYAQEQREGRAAAEFGGSDMPDPFSLSRRFTRW
jgi:hypothetical protein